MAEYGGNENLVPVVANGQVFVASNKQLQIFGLTGISKVATTTTLSSSINPSASGSSSLSALRFPPSRAVAFLRVKSLPRTVRQF